MPPKKQQGTKDIRNFFVRGNDNCGSSSSTSRESSQPGGATGSQPVVTRSQTRVKKEDDDDFMGGHSHNFSLKFNAGAVEEYIIYCQQPRTVLEAIKSHEEYQKTKKCADENIIIQLGKADKESAVPTHFPCSCIEEGVLLIISPRSEKVEKAQNKPFKLVHPQNKYSVFYIESMGGKNTKTKELFISKAIKQFKYLCVYGEKGMTVEESLKRDGRFIDDLGDFTLSDSEDPKKITGCKQMVDSLDGKKFKLCLPMNSKKKVKDEKLKEKPCASSSSPRQCGSAPVLDVAQCGTSVKTVVQRSGSNVDTENIYEILRQQFPSLKKWMEDRFPGDSYQEALNLRKEDFGKIQKSFSECHRIEELLKLGKSVCKITVQDVCYGTGFVLFDNFILTNRHLFKNCVEDRKNLQEGINVSAFFNYDRSLPNPDCYGFSVKKTFVDFSDGELDYAVLELDIEGQKANQTTETKKMKVPAGLLKRFGPLPLSGEACIIGHPAGEVKQMDPTCIIEKNKREKAINDHLEPDRNNMITICSVSQVIRNQGIEKILMGGFGADEVVTYNTFMYHGSSGSPVFDAHCRVFGLHTAGYTYGFPNHTQGVIEYAQPLLTIFERFVTKIKKNGNEELLKRIEKEAKGNSYLEKVLKVEPEDSDEPMDID